AGFPLADMQEARLASLAEEYGVPDRDIDKLLLKVDIVPPSLALAQSIEESGWGTSYFARTGNALFGQRGWGSDTPGMAPAVQKAGDTFRVRAFPWVLDAVKAYVHNLNTHPAYAELRRLRAEAREKGSPPSGYE